MHCTLFVNVHCDVGTSQCTMCRNIREANFSLTLAKNKVTICFRMPVIPQLTGNPNFHL